MKVCHLLTHDPYNMTGGIETVAKELGKGYDIKWLGSGGVKSLATGFFMALRLRFSGYDTIHVHDNAGYWCTRLARNKRIIYTSQGLWKNYFAKNPPGGIRKLDAIILERMQTRLMKKADVVVPITNSLKKRLEEEYKITPTQVVRNGTDTKFFRPLGTTKKFDYIWVGTNPREKKLDEALATAKKAGKTILVVGVSGKDSRYVTYISNAERIQMPELYNSARTFIYFSGQSEYSLVLLEAMACGLNILTGDYILSEITQKWKPAGTIKIGGNTARKVTLDGRTARSIAKKLDWSEARAKYKKIYGGN